MAAYRVWPVTGEREELLWPSPARLRPASGRLKSAPLPSQRRAHGQAMSVLLEQSRKLAPCRAAARAPARVRPRPWTPDEDLRVGVLREIGSAAGSGQRLGLDMPSQYYGTDQTLTSPSNGARVATARPHCGPTAQGSEAKPHQTEPRSTPGRIRTCGIRRRRPVVVLLDRDTRKNLVLPDDGLQRA